MIDFETQLKLQAWLDGELSAAEARQVETWMASRPEAQALVAELRQTKAVLAGNETELKASIPRELYWSGIERAIQRLESPPAFSERQLPIGWWWKLLVPAGVAAVLAIVLVRPFGGARTPALGSSEEVETPLPDTTVFTFRCEKEAVSVVWVDTLGGNTVPNWYPDDVVMYVQ